jgi:hypothetical protein
LWKVFMVVRTMNKAKAVFFGVIFISLAAGCVSTPPPAQATVSAYSVGDRGRVTFDEVVVSLPFRAADGTSMQGYQNLHVVPAALVNERPRTPSGSYAYSSGYTPSSPSEVEGILQRLEIRVNARLSEVLSKLAPQSLNDTANLRDLVIKEAQAVVNEGMAQWEHGRDYRVEMVIASLYWTDSSVGRVSQARGRWF